MMDAARAILLWVARADLALCRLAACSRSLLPLAAIPAGGILLWRCNDMTWDRALKYLAGVAGAVAGLFGEWTTMLTILVAAMAIDYVSGWIVALCGRSPKTEGGGLSSKVGFVGIARKGFIMLLVLLATLLDRAIGNEAMVFQSSLVFYYIANEGLSILENAALMGVPFPDRLKSALEALRQREAEERR